MTQLPVDSATGLPVWDLSDLYSGPDDPGIDADLKAGAGFVKDLAKLQGQFLAARGNAERLGLLIDQAASLYEKAMDQMGGALAYATLASTIDRESTRVATLESDLRTQAAMISADSLFLSLELNQLEDWEIENALKTVEKAQKWRPWLRRIRASRPHELSAELERLMLERMPAVGQWTRLFDETLTRLRAKVGPKNKEESLTLNEALTRLSAPEPAVRKAAALGLTDALKENAPVLALCLNTLAFEKQVEDRWRKYETPAASRHLANEVDKDAVDAMADAVSEAYAGLSHRYYALKARIMGRKQLDFWDRNAPLTQEVQKRYGWNEAKSIVLDSFAQMGPEFEERARVFFDKPWIDAAPRPGKSSGAYAHPVTANRHPYVMLNFTGDRREVLTLAHELGHAVHQTLCQPLGSILADTPLTLAETASIFAEGLVFEHLVADASKDDKKALLAGKIEDGLNSVIRQIAFHRFEERFHAARQAGEVAIPEINAMWLEVMGESLGPAIKLNDGYEYWWAYISHFVHAPFYVYAYSFGDLLVSALMEKRREDPAAFTPLYRNLLAGGGTRTYTEALQPFGMNPRDKSFWKMGVSRLEGLIDGFEAIL
ncbi:MULTISPECIES: M3 family oligoendopeptidase [Asticcacaulis]|uniref:M3 family oligoendopeptidase n=1 Tax=Asticcacaulis TaxID=76890 RepID=UPI001AE364EB|nr:MULTISPECIES: M3 family oligoendopeptidase [Asticcacaulis]MBP2158581.1 oligoendopeptidase F [Asticcacaulis solisilvae]MDR6799627.1 oligoendopeptidase F [Asticcacaulis sp. BE141]